MFTDIATSVTNSLQLSALYLTVGVWWWWRGSQSLSVGWWWSSSAPACPCAASAGSAAPATMPSLYEGQRKTRNTGTGTKKTKASFFRIQIQLKIFVKLNWMRIHADPDPQLWKKLQKILYWSTAHIMQNGIQEDRGGADQTKSVARTPAGCHLWWFVNILISGISDLLTCHLAMICFSLVWTWVLAW